MKTKNLAKRDGLRVLKSKVDTLTDILLSLEQRFEMFGMKLSIINHNTTKKNLLKQRPFTRIETLALTIYRSLYRLVRDSFASLTGPLWLLQLCLHAYFPEIAPEGSSVPPEVDSVMVTVTSTISLLRRVLLPVWTFSSIWAPYQPDGFQPFKDLARGPGYLRSFSRQTRSLRKKILRPGFLSL